MAGGKSRFRAGQVSDRINWNNSAKRRLAPNRVLRATLTAMPQRSTPFQKLVLHIQEQLAAGASVVESAMLRHRGTGSEREVDIVVRATVGEHTVVVALECIEQGRPADQTWVEQMWAKHQQLETNKLVLVSLSGFYAPALELAAFYGIVTYPPEEASTADWTRVVGETKPLLLSRFDFTPEALWLLFEAGEQAIAVPAPPATRVKRLDIDTEASLDELVLSFLYAPAFRDQASRDLAKESKVTVECTFWMDKGWAALDNKMIWHRATGVRVRLRAERRTSPLSVTSIRLNGVHAAFAHASTVLGETLLTVVEKAPGEFDARISVDGTDLQLLSFGDHATPASPVSAG